MAGNKFWGNDSSSESSESDSDSDGPTPAVAQQAPRQGMRRWAEESSSEDEVVQKRTVVSHTDKRYEQMKEKIKLMKNHTNNADFASLITDYEALLKMLDKMKTLVEAEGVPGFFIKAITTLEEYCDKTHAEHVENKASGGAKLPENRQKAFNTLRAKVRKGNKTFEEEVKNCKENPDQFQDEEEEQEQDSDSESSASEAKGSSSSSSDSSDSDSSSSSGSSSGSDSDSDSDSDSSSDSSSQSGEDKSWKSGSDDSDDDEGDEEAAREKKMLRWVITPEQAGKRAQKAEAAAEKEQTAKQSKGKREKKTEKPSKKDRGEKSDKAEKEKEEYTPEELTKKVTEVAQVRGRRGFDRKDYMHKLQKLLEHAEKQGPKNQLYIYCSMVSADFDSTGAALDAMKINMWNEARDKVDKMLPLLIESYHEPASEEKTVVGSDDEESPTSHSRLQQLFVSFVEKLDDELYKALQFTMDVYGAEYQDVLANSSKFLILVKRVYKFLKDTKQTQALSVISLRLMSQLYYKADMLNSAVFQAIRHEAPEEEKDDWIWPDSSKKYMSQLCKSVYAAGDSRQHKKATLCQAYHLALHDFFQPCRDLMHLGNFQEQAQDADVHTQILYNRVLAQMGLCAFRMGKIQDAHNCLMDICMHNKARELLAQGLSFSKNMDRTPEQEREERLRQLPYHMHINLEVLESAHHICAMLLEVPNLAMQSMDPTNKRVISRVLRKGLDHFDKQVYTGPPENAKEAIISAAKALQQGDWQTACGAIEELKIWDHIDPGNLEAGDKVKAMIKEKVQIEALRTYLFAYSSIYDAFHLDQLVDMFGLDPKLVHSIVSKMMIREEISAFWDESSKYVLVQHKEPTPLQRLALTLADRGAQAVENNERLVDQKSGGYSFASREKLPGGAQGGGGRWDQPGAAGGNQRGRFGNKGSMSPVLEKGKGKGKGKGPSLVRPTANRGWDNVRPGALRGGTGARGWATTPNK